MTPIVFGSLNLDLTLRVPRLPQPGETLAGSDFATVPGGKGANQAVAIARLGYPARLVGRVGADEFGAQLRAALRDAGADDGAVAADPAASTGVASIWVAADGQNQIAIAAGANGCVGAAELARLAPLLPGARGLLLQLEVPLAAVVAAAQAARAAGVPTIVDPAPAPDRLPAELYRATTILTPNETEAARLTGVAVADAAGAARAAAILRDRGVAVAIVKLGDRGAFCASAAEEFWLPAFAVTAVDSVAAGDAFNGALATALAEGRSLREAVRWGAAAGALCATRPGAQGAMPTRAAVEALLASG